MIEKIANNVITAIIVSVIISVALIAWERATDGTLIKALGGAVIEDFKQLQCEAFPAEEYQSYVQCREGTFELIKWCSGDCSSDDSKMTICCKQ